MSNLGGLICPACGAQLEADISFDGCDWNSLAGEGSGYDYSIVLNCVNCSRTYPIGRVRKECDFCKNKESVGIVQRLSKLQEGS